jgi:hypothetical protein
MDTARNKPAAPWLAGILQYCGPESTSDTDKRLVEAETPADVLETLERDKDAI